MKCEYCGCKRDAKYFMGWPVGTVKTCGYVCSTHDKLLGRKNLIATGMTLEEAIKFEDYIKKTGE